MDGGLGNYPFVCRPTSDKSKRGFILSQSIWSVEEKPDGENQFLLTKVENYFHSGGFPQG